MSAIIFLVIGSAGIETLLMPSSPIGVTNGFSMANNTEAIFYNPANFEAGDNFNINCFYNRVYVSMQSFSLALGKRIKSVDLGLAIVNFDYGDMEWHPDYPTEDPLISYTGNDLSIIICTGIKVSSLGRIGLNMKWVYENIYTYSDFALAFDLAFSYRNAQNGISFGVSNFGSTITLNNEDVNLPARLSFGGFYSISRVKASLDMHYLINNSLFKFGLGLDYPINELLELKGALNYQEDFYPGFGVTINPGSLQIKYGAAFYPNDLGMINTIGVGIDF